MFDYGDTEPGLGLIVAAGALLPLLAWLALDRAGPRARAVAAVTSALVLLSATATSFGRLAYAGTVLLTEDAQAPGDGALTTNDAFLVLGGLLAGLLLTLVLAPRAVEDRADGERAPADDGDGEAAYVPAPPIAGRAEVIGSDPSDHWTSQVVTRAAGAPLPALRWSPEIATLVALTLGIAVPLSPFFTGGTVLFASRGGGDIGLPGVLALVLDGVLSAIGLLVAALALRLRHVVAVAGAFAVVAAGHGARSAFPDMFSNTRWSMIAIGLTAGLLLPPALRVLGPWLTEDRTAFVVGLALAVGANVGFVVLSNQVRDRIRSEYSFALTLGQLLGDELGDLRGVERGALAEVVAADEQLQRHRVV